MARGLNGTSQGLVTTSVSSLNFSAPATISAWIKLNSTEQAGTFYALTQGSTASNGFFVYFGSVTGTLTNELITIIKIVGGSASVVGYTTATRTEIFDNTWHHIAVVCPGTFWEIWIDGVSKTLTYGVGTNDGSYGSITSASHACWGMRRLSNAYSLYMKGDIAECCIHNVALGTDSIGAIADGFSPRLIRTNAVVEYWPVVGRTSPEVGLFEGNGLTLNNSPTAAAHPRVIYSRKRSVPFVPTAVAPTGGPKAGTLSLLGVGV